MSKRLGTPYKRGNSDVIDNFAPNGGTAVAEGVAVAQTTDGTIKQAAAGDVIIGVSGLAEIKRQSVVRSGLEVYVQLADGATPAIGKPVYVVGGKFTQATKTDQTDNTAVNAVFCTGKVKAKDSNGTEYDAAAIDFAGGL